MNSVRSHRPSHHWHDVCQPQKVKSFLQLLWSCFSDQFFLRCWHILAVPFEFVPPVSWRLNETAVTAKIVMKCDTHANTQSHFKIANQASRGMSPLKTWWKYLFILIELSFSVDQRKSFTKTWWVELLTFTMLSLQTRACQPFLMINLLWVNFVRNDSKKVHHTFNYVWRCTHLGGYFRRTEAAKLAINWWKVVDNDSYAGPRQPDTTSGLSLCEFYSQG